MSGSDIVDQAEALRHSFDAAFATPPVEPKPGEAVLLIGISDQTYAIPLTAVLGLHADRAITAVPAPVRELVGIVGLRGEIVPVYSLAGLLDHDITTRHRWLVMIRERDGEPLALAFDTLVEHVRVGMDANLPSSAPNTRHVRAVVRIDGQPIPILDIPAVVAGIRQRVERAEIRSAG